MITSKKLFLVAASEQNSEAAMKGFVGRKVVVVPEGTADSRELRDKLGFRPNYLQPGRFFWKKDLDFFSVEVTLKTSLKRGADYHHAFATEGYEYLHTSVVSMDAYEDDVLVRRCVKEWVENHQIDLHGHIRPGSMLFSGINLSDF